MRTYGEVIDVRTARSRPDGSDDPCAPSQFLWRGRLYLVRDVLAHWVELGAWWSTRTGRAPGPATAGGHVLPDGSRSVAADVGALEREVWRVEASSGRSSLSGVYDLVRDVPAHTSGAPGRWRLARALD